MLAPDVLPFVRSALPAPPARVLEVGAGRGELAVALRDLGYDVVAIDPKGEPPVRAVALGDLDEPEGSFDAAFAVVSLHHVEPLHESLAVLGRVVRPGGVLAVDELDFERLDERAAAWWLAKQAEAGAPRPIEPGELTAELHAHLHPLAVVRRDLEPWFELGEVVRGPYLHRWELDLSLRGEEERLIAAGRLPLTGARFTGRRRIHPL